MKLGLLTAPFADTTLDEVADWARSAGFEALEIACWPKTSGASRRYAGTSHIDAGTSVAQAKDIAAELAGRRLTISGLGFYPNPLHPDQAHREAVIDHLKNVIVLASRMGVSLVNTFCGGDASKTIDANWETAQKVWPEIIAHAREHGVKLAFENCPMIFSYDEWPGGHNIAYSPYVWRRILEAWGGDVGMNFDPSHLVWQMIDKERFIREFGPHMLHVHAKDLMIDHDGLYERGILSAGIGWQVPRMPGLGDINWSSIFSGLYRAGYDGPVIIEHEDRRFEGSDER
ncbi:sugar phosphate isomerase/epimerase [Mesorhizobium sp. VK4C]|uniref:sugar phosphate isomerase/epimerase family protein n=1 Tax=Mesorhizobium captivum TaxID=3072319 RepID=UPI002A24AE52|nr:sugar phosphate isomerase/epimerase [Mesorhizobium sp. VK4C]MDX8501732.1 sugar phosphate isomerase/epimerase [Mesorhizobium sp. VK4C]